MEYLNFKLRSTPQVRHFYFSILSFDFIRPGLLCLQHFRTFGFLSFFITFPLAYSSFIYRLTSDCPPPRSWVSSFLPRLLCIWNCESKYYSLRILFYFVFYDVSGIFLIGMENLCPQAYSRGKNAIVILCIWTEKRV